MSDRGKTGTRAAGATPLRVAEAVREACVRTALEAFEDARIRGLCDEGALEYALSAVRRLDVEAVAREALDGGE